MWASTDDVLNITGTVVTDTVLNVANSVITVYCNRSEEASAGMGVRDLYWLTQATAWQAKWVASVPDYGLQVQHSTLQQDGMSIGHRAEWEINLAPMAARALKNLSWKADRTKRTPRIEVPIGMGVANFLNEAYDQYDMTWQTYDDGAASIEGWSTQP